MLVIIQTSFLPHFISKLNLVLLFLIIMVFFKGKHNYIIGLIAGLYLDIYSSNIFGIYILFCLLIVFLIKKLQSILDQGIPSYLIISLGILILYQILFSFNIISLIYNFTFLILWLGIRFLYDFVKEKIT